MRPAVAAAAVTAVLAGGAWLLPHLSGAGNKPSEAAATTDTTAEANAVLQETITSATAEKLDYTGFDFAQTVSLADVTITRDEAVKKADAEFGPMAQGTPATVAALGNFTNRTYGKTLADGSIEPFIANRATWMIIYEGVPQTAEGLLPPRGVKVETPKVPGSADFAVFVDAKTGEVLGANTLATPEESLVVGDPGK